MQAPLGQLKVKQEAPLQAFLGVTKSASTEHVMHCLAPCKLAGCRVHCGQLVTCDTQERRRCQHLRSIALRKSKSNDVIERKHKAKLVMEMILSC